MGTVGLSDFVQSANQAVDPVLYDIENEAIERSGAVGRAEGSDFGPTV